MVIRDNLLEIRPISLDDVDQVLAVYQQCEDFLALGPKPKASMAMVLQDIEASRQDKGVFSGVYSTKGNLIGIVDYIPSDFNGDPHVAFISLLMIAASQRNQGIGTRIVKLVEGKIRKLGRASEIQTGVQVNNPGALRFWQRNGFHIFGIPEHRPDQTLVSYLRKKLLPMY